MARRLRKFGLTSAPTSPQVLQFLGHGGGGNARSDILPRVPSSEWSLSELYEIAEVCNPLRKAIQSLKDYMFKEGLEWEAKFSKKCLNPECEYEHPVGDKPKKCVKCGSAALREPDEEATQIVDKFFLRVDRKHSFLDVLRMFEEHLDIADDAFLVVVKNYKGTDREGRPVKWDVDSIRVADPRNFRLIENPRTMEPGGKYWACLEHRPIAKVENGQVKESGRVYQSPGECVECGRKLQDIWYVTVEPGSEDTIKEYYFGDIELEDGRWAQEVIHASKYNPSYGYGKSPIISVMNLALLIIKMEEYMRRFYEEERTPRAALVVSTNNPESFKSAMRTAEDRNVSQGGHHVPKFTFSPAEGGPSQPIQYIEFSKLPAELQMVEQRKEIYQYIGAAYDTTPIFLGINDAAGMQSQGPTQWSVTTLGAQKAQSVYNDKVLPQLIEQLGVSDWNLRLSEVEEKDEMQKWQVMMMETQYAQSMQMLGFKIEGVDVEGHIEISREIDPMGGMGGMMGGMGGFGMGGMGGAPDEDSQMDPSPSNMLSEGDMSPPPIPGGLDADPSTGL